ncbi:MAG: fibronectin type III domain-containing protein [Acidobacteriota bacterium]
MMVLRARSVQTFLAILYLLDLLACAKIGEPQPPQVLVPKPAIDLATRQYGDRILLTVSAPTQNTNGSRLTTLGSVEILRIAGDRQGATPLSEDAFLAQAQSLGSIAAQDLALYRRDGSLAVPDPAPVGPASFYKQGFRYAIRFINRRNQTAGLSNQVYIAPVPIPLAPDKLVSTVTPDSIKITWNEPSANADGSTPARITGYNIYRTEDPKSVPSATVNVALLTKPEFGDRSFEFDKTYYYAVSVVASTANPYAESPPSALQSVTPRDTFPPGIPKSLDAVAENGVVTLLWTAPDDNDVAGYRVYRKEKDATARVLLQTQVVTALSFRDDQVRHGIQYEYSVAAVDTHGNEGPAATVIVEVQ